MTREEAIKTLEKSMECHDRKVCGITEDCEECPLYADKDMEYEAHKVLLACLKQEPCNDTIPTFPSNATNEDVLKTIFPKEKFEKSHAAGDDLFIIGLAGFSRKWLDTPYKAESEDKK